MSKTIRQAILEKKLLSDYGEQINSLKEEIIKVADERISELEKRVVFYVQMEQQEETVNQIVSNIKKLKDIKYKAKFNIFSITQEEIESISFIELGTFYERFLNSLFEGKAEGGIVEGSELGKLTQANPNEKILNLGSTENLPKDIVLNISINGDLANTDKTIQELVNKLFNAKHNEQVVKAVKGEVYIPVKREVFEDELKLAVENANQFAEKILDVLDSYLNLVKTMDENK